MDKEAYIFVLISSSGVLSICCDLLLRTDRTIKKNKKIKKKSKETKKVKSLTDCKLCRFALFLRFACLQSRSALRLL